MCTSFVSAIATHIVLKADGISDTDVFLDYILYHLAILYARCESDCEKLLIILPVKNEQKVMKLDIDYGFESLN